jgi:hypothetical protein
VITVFEDQLPDKKKQLTRKMATKNDDDDEDGDK